MATFNATSKYVIDGSFVGVGALSNPTIAIASTKSQSWGNGTGNNQANQFFQVSSTANASADTYDLTAGITDDFGNTITFLAIKEIMIFNKSTTSGGQLSVAGNFITSSVLTGTSPSILVEPSGRWVLTSPIDSYAVTATTADTISIDPGANSTAYDMILIGIV